MGERGADRSPRDYWLGPPRVPPVRPLLRDRLICLPYAVPDPRLRRPATPRFDEKEGIDSPMTPESGFLLGVQ